MSKAKLPRRSPCDERIVLVIPRELKTRVYEFAATHDMSVSALVRNALAMQLGARG